MGPLMTDTADNLPKDIWFTNTLMRVMADTASTGGQFCMIEQTAPKGYSPPLHVHGREDQLLYVVEGQITAQLDGVNSTVKAGESVWLPRGIPHCFKIESETAKLIEISTPAGFEQFHIGMGEPASAPVIPEPGPVDPAALAEAVASYGGKVLGPPMD